MAETGRRASTDGEHATGPTEKQERGGSLDLIGDPVIESNLALRKLSEAF
ncbi:unnamed protein product, partial [Cylicostephanus goldi]